MTTVAEPRVGTWLHDPLFREAKLVAIKRSYWYEDSRKHFTIDGYELHYADGKTRLWALDELITWPKDGC